VQTDKLRNYYRLQNESPVYQNNAQGAGE